MGVGGGSDLICCGKVGSLGVNDVISTSVSLIMAILDEMTSKWRHGYVIWTSVSYTDT